MSEAAQAEPVKSTTPPVVQPAPAVDVEAVTKRVTEEATKRAQETIEKKATELATEKIVQIGRAMTGEQEKSPEQKLIEDFVSSPVKILSALKDITKKEIKDENDQIRKFQENQRSIAKPIVDEYPEMNSPNKLALAEKLAEQYVNSGMDYNSALEKGLKDTVKEFGLKSVSEAQKDGTYRATGLPGGGGVGTGAPKYDEEKSQRTFVQAMRDKMTSFKKKELASSK